MKLPVLFLIAFVVIILWIPLFVFVLGVFLLIATIFLIAQLTGKPIEVKHDDVVIGHIQYFKYIPIEKDQP